jgi:Cdc6-like AAA superfamily ATPase
MRMRNEQLKTCKALTWVDSSGKSRSRVLLFLVRGADDIAPLDALQVACRARIEAREYKGFEWHAVADPGQISSVDRRLFSAEIIRFEACEFQQLDGKQLASLLDPIIDHIAAGDAELVPRVGGAVGGPAEGIQFLNRSSEVTDLVAAIRKGNSIFLQAPRRMGKTSLMRRVQKELESEFTTLALNLERDPNPLECAARLRSIQTGEGFHAALRAAKADPDRVVRDSLDALCAASEKPLVIFIDELVSLFEGIKAKNEGEKAHCGQVLSFLSALTTPLEAHSARLVVAGSVDWLAYLEAELEITHEELPGLFSRLQKVPVHPLDLENPECELRRLLIGSGLVAEAADMRWFLEHVDLALPFPAAKFLDTVLAETKRRGTTNQRGFDELLSDFLKTTDAFADFDNHLRSKCPIPGASETVADVLGRIASHPFVDGASQDEVQSILLGLEEHESNRIKSWLFDTFPVKAQDGNLRFVSRLFYQWWQTQIAEERGDNE